MSLYLLCITPRYRHAAHYLGFCEGDDVMSRVQQHLTCSAKPSPLVKAALQSGCRVNLVRTWTGETANRTYERKIKDGGQIPAYCPVCRQKRRESTDQLNLEGIAE